MARGPKIGIDERVETQSSADVVALAIQPTHRAALPHAETSPPSAFQMRMNASPRIERSMAIT